MSPLTDSPVSDSALKPHTEGPIFERLPNGLVKGLHYHRRPDGRIQWEKMIDPRHIVFNPKLDAKLTDLYGAPAAKLSYADLIAEGKEVDPKHVLVLLMGLIELADLRGYTGGRPRIAYVCSYPLEAAICSCECTIDWVPNEEEPDGKTSFGTADATMENTGGWGYLSAMAGNRSFCRAVRLGLRIPIMSFDEIAKKDTAIPETTSSPTPLSMHASTLQRAADSKKLTFEQVKQGALTTYRDKMENDPADWIKWEDVPPRDCLSLIKIIKAPKKA